MATINLGAIKFNWQGAYAGGTAYAVDDVVSYNGSSYVCKLASTGNLPTNTTYWDLMSQAGTNGTNGTDLTSTLTTQGDILYRDGSGLQRLGIGSAGQALLVNSGANAVEWGSVSSTGRIIQQVSSRGQGGTFSTTSTTFTTASNDFTLSITPTSTSSKILLSASWTGGGINTSQRCYYSLFRDGTNLATLNGGNTYFVTQEHAGSGYSIEVPMAITFLDSPSSTSAITYSVQLFCQASQTCYLGMNGTGYLLATEIL